MLKRTVLIVIIGLFIAATCALSFAKVPEIQLPNKLGAWGLYKVDGRDITMNMTVIAKEDDNFWLQIVSTGEDIKSNLVKVLYSPEGKPLKMSSKVDGKIQLQEIKKENNPDFTTYTSVDKKNVQVPAGTFHVVKYQSDSSSFRKIWLDNSIGIKLVKFTFLREDDGVLKEWPLSLIEYSK